MVNLHVLESILVWGAIYLFSFASVLLLTGFIFNKEKPLKYAAYLVIPAFIAITIVFATRWARTGYFPANDDLENAITGAWFAVGLTLFLFIRSRTMSGVGLFTVPAALLLLGYGVMKAPAPLPLAASFKSGWMIVHVLFAQLAFGSYAIASGMGLVYILKDKKMRKGEVNPFYEKFPPLEMLEESMFRFVVYGFISEAIMIMAGAIWAKDLWGSYWAWDPVEMWSLISWLLYGLAIHMRVTLGWRGRRLAWFTMLLIITVIITYWGIDALVESTRHVFGVEDFL